MARSTILNQFLYDFKRALRSKTMIIITVIIILLGSALISFINPPSFSATPQNVSFGIYEKNSSYQALVYAYNLFGDPIPNFQISFDLLNSNVSGPIPKVVYSITFNTNSTGFAVVQIPKNVTFDTLRMNYTMNISISTSHPSIYIPFKSLSSKLYNSSFVVNPIIGVESTSNSSRFDVLVFYVGINGTRPSGYEVYATPQNSSQEIDLGSLDNYYKIFKMDNFGTGANVIIKDKSGNIVAQNYVVLNNMQPPINYNQIVYSFISSIMVLLIPLMVIFAGYNLYGKDKINGILDFIHSLPITRTVLGISRYASILLMTVIAIILSLGFSDLIFYIKVNRLFGFTFWSVSLAGLIVTTCALLGLVMIFSVLLRSTGALLGISIVMWVILYLFWGVIIIFISMAFGFGLFTKDYFNLLLHSYFFNPIDYFLLLSIYVTNSISVTGFNIPANPAAYGITLPNLIITGLVWSVVPFIIYLYLLRKRE